MIIMAFKPVIGDRTVIPEEYRSNPTSVNAQLHKLPVMRKHTHDVKGMILFFPRTGLVMTPTKLEDTGWGCTVVVGSKTYPRGGYDLFVCDWEIQRAVDLMPDNGDELGLMTEFGVDFANQPEPSLMPGVDEAKARSRYALAKEMTTTATRLVKRVVVKTAWIEVTPDA